MGSLLVVTGPPGAGKSTVARVLVDRAAQSALVEGDVFFRFLARGAIEPWLAGSEHQNAVVTRAAAAAAGRFAQAGFTTVYDGVLGPWFLPTFAAATALDQLDYLLLLPDVETCVERVRERVGHGFTDEAATRKVHAQLAAAAIDGRHVLEPAGGHARAVADQISAMRRRGDLTYAVH